MIKTIRGLSTLLAVAKLICRVITDFSPTIRKYVPEDRRAIYDNAITGILAGCEVIRAIDWLNDGVGSN